MILNFSPIAGGQSHSKKISIVGEKYDNRQSGLAKLYIAQEKGKQLTPELVEYDYKGSPAVRLLINGVDSGVFLSADSDFYYTSKDKILGYNYLKISCIEDYAEDEDSGIKTDKNGDPIVVSRTYKARLELVEKR